MSSTGAAAGGHSGLSTLSTSLLAAACTAVLAALIFVAVALRRYLRARKRRSLLSTTSSRPVSAAAIYAQHIKAKSISTDEISEPHLNFAPDRAHDARHDLTKMSLSQRTLVSVRQHNFFPMKTFVSPKFPNPALLSPRMQPPVYADLPPPRSPWTPKSPGLTELTMSPGPSILLKPMAYGKSPRVPSPSPSKDTLVNDQKEATEQKKKLTRSAVPSMLLRSLGVLPTSASKPALLSEDNRGLEGAKSQDVADEPSLTPILDLGIDFGNDESFEQALQLRSDFSFDLPTSAVATQPAQSTKVSAGMQSLIEALSPAQPETATLPGLKASPASQLSTLPSPASVRSHLPTPPPSQSLPPAPTSAPMHKMPSNASLQSKASRATAASNASSAKETFHSATGSIGQIFVDMAAFDSAPSPCLPYDEEEQEVLESSYRPLSLGLGPTKSPSQGTFTKIINGLRRPSKSSEIDLEAGNSTVADSMTTRSYSSDAMSYSSSQTSVDLEANSSIGKANIVPAASIPPLPPMPVSMLRVAEDKAPQASFPTVFEGQSDAPKAGAVPVRPMRKRASTLGALDRPKLVMPDLMHPRAAPMPPSPSMAAKMPSPSINVESVEVNCLGLTNLKAKSSDHLPLASTSKGATMNFMSSYHRALIPDPPADGGHLSPGLGADSPIFAQLSPKLRSTSPSMSPKPGFTDTLKARLSLPRKSFSSSPGLASKNSTPNFSPLPSPISATFPLLATGEDVDGAATTDATPKMTASRPEKSSARPGTTPLLSPQPDEVGLGISSPAILFNGQEIEPTKPLRFKKAAPAGGLLGGSPQSVYSAASPSPMLHAGQWATSPANDRAATPSESLYSPLIPIGEASLSSSTERIEFGVASSPDVHSVPSAPAMLHQDLPPTSPNDGDVTPRPPSTSSAGARADDEDEHLHYRDSVISVAASTISMMSNSTCMSDSMGDDLDLAADRRAKLLASVQQNVAKAQAKDAKRDSQAAERYRLSQMPKTSSLRNIPEESSTMGLGLFESEEEVEEEEEREELDDSPKRAYGRKKVNDLILAPPQQRVVGPLTPPLTPIDGTAMYQSRHAPSESTSSASSMGSTTSIPLRLRPMRGAARNLAPIDTAAAAHLSPYGGEVSPSSLKLRPLSLAASLNGDGSPMKRNDRAFSPALRSPVPAHMGGDRSSRYNDEGRSSRSTTYRAGGILPVVGANSAALESRRVAHAEPSLTHSDSSSSLGSMSSSLGSFSRMGHFPSPVKSTFAQAGMGKSMGMRGMMGSRGSEVGDMPESSSVQSFASSNMGRIGYKTSDLSVAI
ncbi:hypothetical protein PSEUBRA_004595 [Kalmanozyma brasiliensis GHG001]|uniref:Uncharacterized protein n=1 Tax=Kalmanozyma brasiliensis (strain GHG001) TaxID=1365824 RepID=V5ENM1_KALBG|nr:uncharacterized protein PSEUBRA_004595 [Kalmanozyma brasiliensis GHG001]EST06680.1 hypothetical protein PSEUBRA_004595 [Kalmanozyma brasiliensis GHG001]